MKYLNTKNRTYGFSTTAISAVLLFGKLILLLINQKIASEYIKNILF